MSTATGGLDRVRVTDERLVELLLAVVLTMVVIVAISWAVDAAYEPNTAAAVAYLFGTVFGFAVAVAIRFAHPLGFVGAIVYFGAVIGDVLIAGSGFHGPLGIPGAIGLFVVGTGILFLCRDAFFDGDASSLREYALFE